MTVLTRNDAFRLIVEQGRDIVIPDTFTSLEPRAFEGLGLTSVVFPDTIERIAPLSFANNELTSVFIPGNIVQIQLSAFENNRLKEVVFEKGKLNSILSNAFANNELEKITLPNNRQGIVVSSAVFIDNSLREVDLGSTFIVGRAAFFGNKLTEVTFNEKEQGTLSIEEDAFAFNKIESVNFPQGDRRYVSILSNAFRGNRLSEVFLPDTVALIEDDAFAANPIQVAFIPNFFSAIERASAFSAFDASIDVVLRKQGVVESAESFQLGSENNNLFLIGDAKIDGVGNFRSNLIVGNDKNNKLQGKRGDDFLIGNRGKDVMSGGPGDDTFIFRSISDSGITRRSRDIITDFSAGDVIDLRQIDSQPVVRGNQPLEFIGAREFTESGQVRFDSGILSVNTVGDLNADFQVFLKGVTELFDNSLFL